VVILLERIPFARSFWRAAESVYIRVTLGSFPGFKNLTAQRVFPAVRADLEVSRYNRGDFMPGTEIIFDVQESPEGGFEARALGHPIFTQAETLDELKTMVRDAVRCHFDEGDSPPVIRLHIVKDEVISA
jgi:hypothetical protein